MSIRSKLAWFSLLLGIAGSIFAVIGTDLGKIVFGDKLERKLDQLGDTYRDENAKLEQALSELGGEVERQRHLAGMALSPEELRARAVAALEDKYALPAGTAQASLESYALTLRNSPGYPKLLKAHAAFALEAYEDAEALFLEVAGDCRQERARTGQDTASHRQPEVKALVEAGRSARQAKHMDDALAHLRQAESLTDQTQDPLAWADVQFAVAFEMIQTDLSGEQPSRWKEIYTIFLEHLGPYHFNTLCAKLNLGDVLSHSQPEQAEPILRSALADLESLPIPLERKLPAKLMALNTLGLSLTAQDKQDEAIEAYRRSLKGFPSLQQSLSNQTMDLCHRYNLGNALGRAKRYQEAEAEHRVVYDRRRELLGPTHRDTLVSEGRLMLALQALDQKVEAMALWHPFESRLGRMQQEAMDCRRDGNFARSVELNQELLYIRALVFGLNHETTLAIQNNLANAMDDLGKHAQAENLMRRVIEGRQQVLGAEHPHTLQSQVNLVAMMMQQSKVDETRKHLLGVIPQLERHLGPDDPLTQHARTVLEMVGPEGGPAADPNSHADLEAERAARALFEKREFLAAESAFRTLAEHYQARRGPTHSDTLKMRDQLAECLMARERQPEAEAEYRAVLEVRERTLGPDHLDVYLSCIQLAFCLGPARSEEAIPYAQRAESGCLKHLGPDHPRTQSAAFVREMMELPSKLREKAPEKHPSASGGKPD